VPGGRLSSIDTLTEDAGREAEGAPAALTAVVITTYNHAHYLAAAIQSALKQTRRADEIIVVDDGSQDDPAAIVARYPGVRLIRQENQGLSAARNTGLIAARADYILFLDADDRLRPGAIRAGLDCFDEYPEAGFVYGGYYLTDRKHRRISKDVHNPIGDEPFKTFLEGNAIGMHATVLYRRAVLQSLGGFDASLRRCEDYDVYLRLSLVTSVASHGETVAEYRMHDANMSNAHREMLKWALLVHARQQQPATPDPKLRKAWCVGRRGWIDYYGSEILKFNLKSWYIGGQKAAKLSLVAENVREFPRAGLRLAPELLWRAWRTLVIGKAIRLFPPATRKQVKELKWRFQNMLPKPISFGDLGGVAPISDEFGYDRGTPVDRQYIGEFLLKYAADIGGRALEIGDDEYCRRFGAARITQQDVLHVHRGNPLATIVGDMSEPDVLPSAAFDVLVLTQTLHLIWDMRAAVREMHRSLKTGGVVLLTVPGISRVDRDEWGATWYWSLTEPSARRLFVEVFGEENVTVEVYGNVYAATAFIQGLALEEVDFEKLRVVDPAFPVVVAVRAVKAWE
jgi:glycosyltransferase involved in cell wall biosynthesis